MRALIQRVSEACVVVENSCVGKIGPGLLVFLGIEKTDTEKIADRLLRKVLNYRVFSDADGKMNLNVQQVGGGVLIVSQFTLVADTHKGLRPSFSTAAEPLRAKSLYHYFTNQARASHNTVATGEFAADMQVQLINDGPVTFILEAG